jgi:hypothetical protein
VLIKQTDVVACFFNFPAGVMLIGSAGGLSGTERGAAV